ncbi:MAG: hypothetical protein JWO46_2891 [Nocardioidaceae bacterium]|nr:hypothetical protein [Nocardioidaceae bacterium]
MRSRLTSALAVIGAVVLLLVAGNTAAYAAGGHGFSLGHNNKTKKQTTLTRTRPGPTLALNATAGSPPLAVNSAVKVGNLNADSVDGLDSSQLQTHSYVFSSTVSSKTTATINTAVPTGSYLVSYSTFFSYPTTSAQGVECYMSDGASLTAITALATPAASPFVPSLSGSGFITKTPTNALKLVCYSTTTWSSAAPIQVVLTPTTLAGGGGVTAARTSDAARTTNLP